MQHLLPEDEAQRTHHDAVDGVGAELGAKDLEAYGKEDGIDDEVEHTDWQRHTGGDVEH